MQPARGPFRGYRKVWIETADLTVGEGLRSVSRTLDEGFLNVNVPRASKDIVSTGPHFSIPQRKSIMRTIARRATGSLQSGQWLANWKGLEAAKAADRTQSQTHSE